MMLRPRCLSVQYAIRVETNSDLIAKLNHRRDVTDEEEENR